MFQRILVPLDGSPRAEQAIPVAARIARAFGGSVIVLSVVLPPVSSGKFSVQAADPKAVLDEELAEATNYLHKIAQSHELDGITTEVQTFVGAVAPRILAATQLLHADLIVLWSHGYTGFKRWVMGSVAHKLVSHSPVPVLFLRNDGLEPATAVQQPVRTLVALDGSSLSEAMLEPAAFLTAGLAHATSKPGVLQLMRVVDIPPSYGKFRSMVDSYYDAEVRAEAKREYEHYLEGVARRFSEGELAKYNLAVTITVATDPDVAEAIVQTAEQGKFDLIAMATHGRGGMQLWAMGSTTERVLHAARLPLFIVRPQDASSGLHPKGFS